MSGRRSDTTGRRVRRSSGLLRSNCVSALTLGIADLLVAVTSSSSPLRSARPVRVLLRVAGACATEELMAVDWRDSVLEKLARPWTDSTRAP